MVKMIYVILGFIFFGIGVVGTILPVLPTVPFFILASFFFARGSQRFNKWFISTALYKKHLESFNKSRSMTLKTKIIILGFASVMLIIAFVFSRNIYARVLITVAFIFKYYYFIFRIRTIKSTSLEMMKQ